MLTYHSLFQPFEVLPGLFPFVIEQSKKQKGVMTRQGGIRDLRRYYWHLQINQQNKPTHTQPSSVFKLARPRQDIWESESQEQTSYDFAGVRESRGNV